MFFFLIFENAGKHTWTFYFTAAAHAHFFELTDVALRVNSKVTFEFQMVFFAFGALMLTIRVRGECSAAAGNEIYRVKSMLV